jgi:glycosyltransferase involved in cell wall biosynthesis
LNFDDYDLIFLFYWPDFFKLKNKIDKNKLILGIFSYRSWKNKKNKLKQAVQDTKCIITNSRDLKKELKDIHDKIYFAPNGIDHKKFKPTNKLSEKIFKIGWMGDETSKEKGLDSIIRPAIQKMEDVELVINDLPYEKQNDFYKKIDVYVCASETETGPNPVFQAGACGVPVITTKTGEAKYLIKNKRNGMIIKRNEKSLRDAILKIKNNPKLLKKMSKKIRKEIEKKWTWDKLINNYKKIFDVCLEKN